MDHEYPDENPFCSHHSIKKKKKKFFLWTHLPWVPVISFYKAHTKEGF